MINGRLEMPREKHAAIQDIYGFVHVGAGVVQVARAQVPGDRRLRPAAIEICELNSKTRTPASVVHKTCCSPNQRKGTGLRWAQLKVMPPGGKKQVAMECIERIQIIVTQPEFIIGAGIPSEMGRKSGGKLRIRKGRERGFCILRTGESAEIPLGACAKIPREEQLRIIQQVASGTVIATGDARRFAASGFKLGVVIEAEVGEAIGGPNVRMVSAKRLAEISVNAPATVGSEILAGIKAIGISHRSVIVMRGI